jgi:hypothetical protein
MPEHGQHDPQELKWFCGYWMTFEEWEGVHDYAPPYSSAAAQEEKEEQEEEE